MYNYKFIWRETLMHSQHSYIDCVGALRNHSPSVSSRAASHLPFDPRDPTQTLPFFSLLQFWDLKSYPIPSL